MHWVIDKGIGWHILPINDLRDHDMTKECWCQPTEDLVVSDLWIHSSMDKREEFEEGRLPS